MKKYKVALLNSLGETVLEHYLLAANDESARVKCEILVKEAKDNSVVGYKLLN
jgi:hypothetical protein